MLPGLLAILAGHFLADYLLQHTRLGAYKRSSAAGLALHALSWAAAMTPGLMMLQSFAPWKLFFLFASHLLIDGAKNALFLGRRGMCTPVNLADQLLHMATLAVAISC